MTGLIVDAATHVSGMDSVYSHFHARKTAKAMVSINGGEKIILKNQPPLAALASMMREVTRNMGLEKKIIPVELP